MGSSYSFDGRILEWYAMTSRVGPFWDTWFAQKYTFRSYTHGKQNSAKKAAYRFSMILRKNARWLDGSDKTDIEVLLDTWEAKMLGVAAYFDTNGIEENSDLFNRPVNPLLTFWGFHDGGCKHIHVLNALQLGQDPDNALAADEQRRKDKSVILKSFKDEVMAFIKDAAYLSGSDKHSNQKLDQALTIARQAMEQARSDLKFQEK